MKRIERRVNGFKANLEREMLAEHLELQARKPAKSPQLYKSSIKFDQSLPSLTSPKISNSAPVPREVLGVEQVARVLGERPYVEVSATEFAHFRRTPGSKDRKGNVFDKASNIGEDKQKKSKKGLLRNWFRGKE